MPSQVKVANVVYMLRRLRDAEDDPEKESYLSAVIVHILGMYPTQDYTKRIWEKHLVDQLQRPTISFELGKEGATTGDVVRVVTPKV